MKLKNIGIAKKLFIGFGIILILNIIVIIWSIIQMNISNIEISKNQIKQNLKDTLIGREIDHLDWVSRVSNGLLIGKAEAINVETDGHKCKFGQWYYSENRTMAEKDMQGLKAEFQMIEGPHLSLHQEVVSLKESLQRGGEQGRMKAHLIYSDKILINLKEIRQRLTKANDIIRNDVLNSEKSIADSIMWGKILIVCLGFMSLIIGVTIALLISRSIVKPIRLSLGFASKIAEGDFTERIELSQKDELGLLVSALNTSADKLESLISDIIIGTQSLSEAVQEIASGNENLSQRTTEEASAIEEIASTIEEATATIRQNSANSQDAKKSSEEVINVTQEAKRTSFKAIEIAENGGKVVEKAVDSINEVNKSSNKISNILKVINEIAFQTNLLALNAAVEAARAGEQGRGFAVVAGEVRNLAQRSASAANEISDMIKESIEKVENGTKLVNKSGDSLIEIIEASKASGEALEKVIKAIDQVSRLIAEIALAGEEQRKGMEQINTAVMEMDSLTQQNASLVEETASASEEMANQSQYLISMIKKFKIRDDTQNESNESYEKSHKKFHFHADVKELQKKKKANGNGRKKQAAAAAPDAKREDIMNVPTPEGFDEF